MNYFELIQVAFFIAYVILILYFFWGWHLIPSEKEENEQKNQIPFSILISARNEADCILENLNNLRQQTYSINLFEVIVINDYSTDGTLEIVVDFKKRYPEFPIQVVDLKNHPSISNKKQAITLGVEMATHDWILLTDADCTRQANWMQALNQFLIKNPHLNFVYAPVCLLATNWFEKLQALEFTGLLGIGAGSIQLSTPNMCSAANLAFHKAAFTAVNGYEGNQHIASGDDEFLMHKIHHKMPGTLAFLKDFRAIVYTRSASNVKQFVEQRKRWVSKSTKYENKSITGILIGAYLLNLFIAFDLLMLVWDFNTFKLGVELLVVKTLIEGLFIYSVLKFFKTELYIWLLPIAAPLHVLYVIVIGFLANSKTYHWKGRIH